MAKEYIERGALVLKVRRHLMPNVDIDGTVSVEDAERYFLKLLDEQPTADMVEVVHGKWHIMPEDPEDESECPTEEGWYRIITTDGEEMTDYYFNKPTLVGRGVVYWKNCKKGIRAWAKMDGKGDE